MLFFIEHIHSQHAHEAQHRARDREKGAHRTQTSPGLDNNNSFVTAHLRHRLVLEEGVVRGRHDSQRERDNRQREHGSDGKGPPGSSANADSVPHPRHVAVQERREDCQRRHHFVGILAQHIPCR